MPAEVMPGTGSLPRRARRLIPTELPRRGEVIAGCAVLIIAAHLLLAQLTLLLAIAFAVVTRVSRWRLWWLAGPAAAGLAWALLAGPAAAVTGFTVGPAHVLGYLGGGHLLARLSHPSAAFAGAAGWLPRQFPIALAAAAAEAALAGWLSWLGTDEWAVPPPRPGVLAALCTALTSRLILAGAVLTRDGCALGVDPATGRCVALGWAEAADGILVAGASEKAVTVTSLQLAHAALRRRKPLIVLDLSGDPSLAHAVTAACAATGVPLHVPQAAAEPVSEVLGRAVMERSAVLLRPRSAAEASQACAGIAALGDGLRRLGVDGDGLIWVRGADLLPAEAVAALLTGAPAAGLPALLSTSSPAAAAELADMVGAVLTLRLAARDCAVRLAAKTGTRLRPAKPADLSLSVPSAGEADGGLVPCPAVPAGTLLALGHGQFVLAVSAPRYRLVELARLVPARLPRDWARQAAGQELARQPEYRPAAFLAAAASTEPGWRGSEP